MLWLLLYNFAFINQTLCQCSCIKHFDLAIKDKDALKNVHLTFAAMIVHATAITSLTDARYFAAREVQALGFVLDEGHARYIDPGAMRAIKEWVQGPAMAGWFYTTPLATVAEAARFFGLDSVVVSLENWNEGAALLSRIPYQFFLRSGQHLPPDAQPEAVICQVSDVETDAAWVTEICRRRPTLVQITTYDPQQLEAWLALGAQGFCVLGGAEERTGVKEFTDLEMFFDWAEAYNQEAS